MTVLILQTFFHRLGKDSGDVSALSRIFSIRQKITDYKKAFIVPSELATLAVFAAARGIVTNAGPGLVTITLTGMIASILYLLAKVGLLGKLFNKMGEFSLMFIMVMILIFLMFSIRIVGTFGWTFSFRLFFMLIGIPLGLLASDLIYDFAMQLNLNFVIRVCGDLGGNFSQSERTQTDL